MKKIIILIGPPACGKGTQAKKIAANHNYIHISTGELLRKMATDQNLGEKEKVALEEMKKGKLVPDWLIYDLAFKMIEKCLDEGKGVVLDGVIRSLKQAEKFQQYFKENKLINELQAVEITLTDQESLERSTKRRICKECKEIIPWLPATYEIKNCPKCSGELEIRSDDSPEIIKKRIVEQGNVVLKPILEYYKNAGFLKSIDGMKDIEGVWKDLQQLIK